MARRSLARVRAAIADKLDSRLRLFPSRAMSYFMSKYVVGVIDLDELLCAQKEDMDTKDISAAAGSFVTYFTVPTDKRWKVMLCEVASTTANTAVGVKLSGVDHEVETHANSARFVESVRNLILSENDEIGAYTTGNGADSAIVMVIFYLEYDAF